MADESFKVRLRDWKIHRVTGRSRDGAHAELGWLVPCAKRTATKIGREFRQDAIFWGKGDSLSILDTSMNRAPHRVGSFREKYCMKPGKPSLEPTILGGEACRRFIKQAVVSFTESELLFGGDGAESPYHQWRLSFAILSAPLNGVWALKETDLPCRNDGESEDDEPFSTVVALMVDSSLTLNSAAERLIEAWRATGPRWIDGITGVSELGRKLPHDLLR